MAKSEPKTLLRLPLAHIPAAFLSATCTLNLTRWEASLGGVPGRAGPTALGPRPRVLPLSSLAHWI